MYGGNGMFCLLSAVLQSGTIATKRCDMLWSTVSEFISFDKEQSQVGWDGGTIRT